MDARTILRARASGEEEEEEEENEGGKGAQLDPLMAKFLKTRAILLSGEVNKELAERVVKQLLLLDGESADPIKVFIDSPGGDVDAGFAIFDMIRFVDAPVHIVGMGLVASAAALILIASPKERRYALPNSHYLIHQPLSGMRGVATDIEIHAREIEKVKAKINAIIAEETGQALDKVQRDTDRDYWLNADEAKDYGLISKIVAKKADLGL
jgi:ATP-dependent Clp protease, protease subunit